MDYTQSNSFVVHPGTGRNMHDESQAVPTAVSDKDMNSVIWSVMEILNAGGVAGQQFDPAVPASYQGLLTALRSAGVFQTAAQFDNTTKAVTTAFLKRHGLQASGLSLVTVTGALAAAHVGGTVAINSAASTTHTLPAANSVPGGARIEFMNINTGAATVARAGADTVQVSSVAVTSLPLRNGDTLTLESDGVSKWYAVAGSAQQRYASVFGGVQGSSGWKELPGGDIVQWTAATITSGASVPWPIGFPVACDWAMSGTSGNAYSWVNAFTQANATVGHSGGSTLGIRVFGIGR